ncbi:MAG: (d)CMP kinase, partial [Candidatus Omnitrophota bacterium]
SDAASIIELARNTAIDLLNNPDGTIKVTVDGLDVSKEIREPRITRYVSDIAKIKEVRDIMVSLQRRLGSMSDSVLDGRDIGTVVFPDADRKFYLDANFKERGRRRYKELLESGSKVSLEEIEADVLNRDTIDSNREVGPLKKATDAFYIDTTSMNISEVVDVLLTRII